MCSFSIFHMQFSHLGNFKVLAKCDGGKVSLSFILNALDLIWSKPWLYFMMIFAFYYRGSDY